MKYKSLALFCGSMEGNDPQYIQQASKFGELLAKKGIALYYGGGSIGLMGAAATACMQHGGKAIGVAPDFFKKGAVLSENVTEMIYVHTMGERKQVLEHTADGFVVFPGGYGTMDELFEVLTDSQLGMHQKPIVLFNLNGYYDSLIALLNRFSQDGFLRSFHKGLLMSANTLEELFDVLDQYESTNSQDWLNKIRH